MAENRPKNNLLGSFKGVIQGHASRLQLGRSDVSLPMRIPSTSDLQLGLHVLNHLPRIQMSERTKGHPNGKGLEETKSILRSPPLGSHCDLAMEMQASIKQCACHDMAIYY